MTTPYTRDYFLAKFQAIPEDKWLTGSYGSCNPGASGCALGLCGGFTDEAEALRVLFCPSAPETARVAYVNDNQSEKHPEPTPKQRILAALRALG